MFGFGKGDDAAVRVFDGQRQGQGLVGGGGVGQRGLDLNRGKLFAGSGGGDKRAAVVDAERVGDAQAGVAIDARAGVPAGVGKFRMIHADGKDIIDAAETQMRRQVVLEADVAEGAFAEGLTVEPDFGVVVDAVKLDDISSLYVV